MDNKKEYARNKTTADISWDAGKESVLREIKMIFSDLLEGSQFYIERNTTPTEESIDIYRYGEKNRVSSIWPKTRSKCVDLLLHEEYVDAVKAKIELPEDQDVKRTTSYRSRKFKAISIEKTIEIIDYLANE